MSIYLRRTTIAGLPRVIERIWHFLTFRRLFILTDCSYWIRSVRSEVMRKKLAITDPNRGPRTPPTTRMISKMLASNLYNLSKKGLDLSVGTMVVGWDKEEGSNIWMVDDKGKRLSGKVFSLGSGSTYALGVLDDCLR